MRRSIGTVLVSVVMVLALGLSAGAGGFHFKSFNFTSGSLTFDGVGVGLGNTEFDAVLSATATVTAQCKNKGGTTAPGRNDITASAEGEATSFTTDDRGQTNVVLTVADPGLPDLDAPPSSKTDCPNGKWSISGVSVNEWTSAHLLLTESATGAVLFEQDYICSGGGTMTDASGNVIPLSCVEA
ncbi:MAG TPA: hypothetical protein VIW94_03510 [Acidimicrobiia bacterium]